MSSVSETDGEATRPGTRQALRPASFVMSPERARASYPNALSFARTLVRKMQRDGWRISTVRIELDSEGRGEALYRIDAGDRRFHYLVISSVFPADEKVDRSFGVNWDVSAALCQGDWNAEREAFLRREIPKQYAGRYDADVLCFCRGNRSERIFDHVVERLGAGLQPDPALLATVGYLLRSTAFAGNGLFGMTPYEALGPDHPLGAPYHAQMLAAFLLREFVSDLADVMAAARGSGAAQLDRRLRRYLGIGNSAGLGLVPFIAAHPGIIHRWTLTHEEALAAAKDRLRDAPPETAAAFLALVEKAILYFGQEARDGNGVFASYEVLAAELRAVHERASMPLPIGGALVWADLLSWIDRSRHPETVEIVGGLLIELFPDMVEVLERRLAAVERVDIVPEMTAGELRVTVERGYGWLRPGEGRDPAETAFFWYYPVEAPDEPRRGRRGVAPFYEFETRMDLPLQLDRLAAALADEPVEASVGAFVAGRPDLRAIVARVQSVSGLPYADLRDNFISGAFTPFAACRFLLAFYGMEKFDPRPPRSTKGALLQGAPIADEIESGVRGDWPFPLFPDLGPAPIVPLQPLRSVEAPETPIERIKELKVASAPAQAGSQATTMFPLELRRLVTKACLSGGHALGTAEFVAETAETCMALRRCDLAAVLGALESVPDGTPTIEADGYAHRINGAAWPAFAVAPAALDLACLVAGRRGSGYVGVSGVTASPLLLGVVLRAADRGFLALLRDGQGGELFAAAPGRDGWLARRPWSPDFTRGLRAVVGPRASAALADADASAFCLVCLAPGQAAAARTSLRPAGSERDGWWEAGQLRTAAAAANRTGFALTGENYARLTEMAKRTLVPDGVEREIT